MLTGLSQNGTVAGTGAHQSPVMATQRYRRTESPSPVLVNRAERGKPVSLLLRREESRKANRGQCGYGGGKKRTPSCTGTATGCNLTRRASELTSLRCPDTRTTEALIQQVWHMSVDMCHWCDLPLSLSERASCPWMSHGAELGINFRLVSCSQQVFGRLTGPSHGLRDA
jgi:hypothetical protein